jgi:hypothetical protein
VSCRCRPSVQPQRRLLNGWGALMGGKMWEKAMLKISLIDNARRRRLIVEGKLIAPWATELRTACEAARTDLRGRQLVIEMNHITTISQEGENVILQLMNGGNEFRCHGVFTKHIFEQLTRRARNLGRRRGE